MKSGLKTVVFSAFLALACTSTAEEPANAGGSGGASAGGSSGTGGGVAGAATGGAAGADADVGIGGAAGAPVDAGPDVEAPKPPRVLLLGPPEMSDLAEKLMATGAFEKVDVFDIGKTLCAPGALTPTLEELLEYDVALAHVLAIPPQTHFELNDVLADYYDAGGRVVLATPFDGFLMGGRFSGHSCTDSNCTVKCTAIDKHYNLFVDGLLPSANLTTPESMGTVLVPESPLLKDVKTVTSSVTFHLTQVTTDPDTVTVASWPDGSPMILTGTVDGRKRVDLNFIPLSSDVSQLGFSGDGVLLLRNALLYQ